MEMKQEKGFDGKESRGWSTAVIELEKDLKEGKKAVLEMHLLTKLHFPKKRGRSLSKVWLAMLLTVGMTAGLVGCSARGSWRNDGSRCAGGHTGDRRAAGEAGSFPTGDAAGKGGG